MREKLEAAIESNPDDVDAYLVYADYLQNQGDPRGELIVLQHQGKTAEANALIARAQLLGDLADFVTKAPEKARTKRVLQLEWQLGFIKRAHIGWETYRGATRDEAVGHFVQFLALPSTRFLQELVVGPVPASDFMSFGPWVKALAEAARPQTLRSLTIGDIGHWDISGTSAGPFEAIMQAFPRLRRLTVHAGDISLGKMDHDELRELAVETGGIGNAIVDVALAKLPKLERLEVWLGTPNYGGSIDVDELTPIFDGANLPSVVHLGLKNAVYTDDIVRRLIESKILPRLKTLDLRMGTLSDAGVRDMANARAAFAHLDELWLDDNALTDASRPLVAGLAKVVHFGDRHDPERIEEEDLESRYTSVGE